MDAREANRAWQNLASTQFVDESLTVVRGFAMYHPLSARGDSTAGFSEHDPHWMMHVCDLDEGLALLAGVTPTCG
jgi:hypothetical protein